ncbi:MAG: hypothetical protein RSC24_06840 [Clostridium sp.]
MDTIIGWIENFGNWMLDGVKEAILGLLEWIALGIIDNSYWICLLAGIIGLLLYIAGQKRAGKYVSGSLIIYFILQAFGQAIRGAK